MDEDYNLCSKSMEYYAELEEYKERILKKKETTDLKTTEPKHAFALQEEMQTFMMKQSERQQEFIERQSQRQQIFMEKQSEQQQELMEKISGTREHSKFLKLPKLDLTSFSGNKLKWPEFWDSFDCAVHGNDKLSDIEKFSYLRSKLVGEAKASISGLALSNDNYSVAIALLQDRYGKKQEIIDLHYSKLMTIVPPTSKTDSLRFFLDTIEKHLRSLEVLRENVNQNMFVSMIKSKVPKDVLLHLEVQKGSEKEWTVADLRKQLRAYIIARERTEQDDSPNSGNSERSRNFCYGRSVKPANFKYRRYDMRGKDKFVNSRRNTEHTMSAEALVSTDKPRTPKSYADQCRYCKKSHWSDECPTYRTIESRKKMLKDSCFKCLKFGHLSRECKGNKVCVYCGEKNVHHKSLCPKKFIHNAVNETVHVMEEITTETGLAESSDENVLVSTGEIVLMQTA
ncbi:uncharacterized protein LOC123558301 [Mercenaria mercenaria]|uniref:uncharacterized protein LOC123558301 n=1 Tax=Mercenaria mercenaria TaxID=6596 RepID=UPI00234F46B6|nr:uncharacterized protein LOC123558301 [Mercenaria mercenaria]